MDIDIVKQFMNQFQTCVLSTVRDNKPQSATVGFSVDDELNILVATQLSTRKASNILSNPFVSIVIGFEGNKTVQIEGKATQATADELADRLEIHYEKVPSAKKFASYEGQAYFLIRPSWPRYTDYTAPEPVSEMENLQ